MAMKIIQYSTVQFANLVGVCASTVRRWDNDKLLVAHRASNGKRYYTKDDVTTATKDFIIPTLELVTRYTSGEFAKIIGVSILTVQNWDNKGLLVANRTVTNRRFYTQEHVNKATEGIKVS